MIQANPKSPILDKYFYVEHEMNATHLDMGINKREVQ